MSTKNTDTSTNTPRVLNAEGQPLIPSAYEFEYINMTNREGATQDIKKIVTSLDVIEDLYSPVVVVKISIRDNINFFEDFKLSGQEIVEIKIKKLKSGGEFDQLTFTFVVKDYPDFEKTNESINVQEYSINAVSSYAYLSRLQQISRSVKGNPIDLIKEVFTKDIAFTKFDDSKNTHPCITEFKGVITKRTPLQAIKWLQGKAFDAEKTPFFVYATIIDGKIVYRSWQSITSTQNKVYPSEAKPYVIIPYSKFKPGSAEFYDEQISKIISMKSNLKLDKLTQAVNGGFGTTLDLVDYANRTYTEKSFDPPDKIKLKDTTAGKEKENDKNKSFEFLKKLGIDAAKFTTLLDANRIEFHLPLPPYDDGSKSVSEILVENISDSNFYKANMESATHELVVYGDFNLNPSKKIKIEIPKALDPSNNSTGGDALDKSLSGVYIIALSIHSFKNGVYVNRLKLIKDNV